MTQTLNKPVSQMSDAEKTAHIKKVVTQAGVELRERHPWLKHQNLIGVAIMVFAVAGMLGAAALYYYGLIAWWLCIPVVAIFASLTHELEHDLIHLMYFRDKRWANDLMMAIGWLTRPSTVSPFVRRRLHLHHHKHSGTESDLEERGITNGERWGLKRLLMVSDNMLSIYLRPFKMRKMVREYIKAQQPKNKAELQALIREQLTSYMPLGYLHYGLWHGFLAFHAVSLVSSWVGMPISWPVWLLSMMGVVNFLAVVWLAPNFLRQTAIQFVSSNMHYYGDVEDGNIMQQTQVLNVWWMLPFHLFCFNFGSTHAIHHFVVKEPFYVRQWTAATAHKVMREMGVRFNDIDNMRRANRYKREGDSLPQASTQAA